MKKIVLIISLLLVSLMGYGQFDGKGTFHSDTVSGYVDPGYKVYVAKITKLDTLSPIVTVYENTLGDNIVWTRIGVGNCRGTLSTAFTINKTIAFISFTSRSDGSFISYDDSGFPNYIDITNYNSSGLQEENFEAIIEIRVYP